MGSIYCIENVVNNKVYVGSSKQVKKRWRAHKNSLKYGNHHNVYLQRSWDKYGDVFKYFILESNIPEGDLFTKEREWIMLVSPEYNIGGVCGGDNFSNHPDKESIREVHRSNLKKLRDEGRVPKTASGEDNPNWKGGVSGYNLCKCGNTKKFTSTLCKQCNDTSRVGELNSFYGKTHSPYTRSLISEANKGKEVPSIRKSLVGDGVFFSACFEAAEFLGVAQGTITHRVNSDNYPFWFFTEDESDIESYIPPTKEDFWYCKVDEVVFNSLAEVVEHTGVKGSTVYYRLNSSNFIKWVKNPNFRKG